MTLRIEIQEQPERNRFFSEVEVGGMIARRKLVSTERTKDLLVDFDTHCEAIRDALREMVPGLGGVVTAERPALASLPPAPEVAAPRARVAQEPRDAAPVDLDALRAEAEAAGIDVDGRWGETRLRVEIARASARDE